MEKLVANEAHALAKNNAQKAVPAIAKDINLATDIEVAVSCLKTQHQLILGDSRTGRTQSQMRVSILIVTSPPY